MALAETAHLAYVPGAVRHVRNMPTCRGRAARAGLRAAVRPVRIRPSSASRYQAPRCPPADLATLRRNGELRHRCALLEPCSRSATTWIAPAIGRWFRHQRLESFLSFAQARAPE